MSPQSLQADHEHILIVEDDEQLLEFISEFVQELGFGVEEACDGEAAFRTLSAGRLRGAPPPGAILLDLMMAGMNGWRFRYEQLRDPRFAEIPVIVMSASGLACGVSASAHLQKPFGFRDLRASLGTVFGPH